MPDSEMVVSLGGFVLGGRRAPVFVAELSGNHNHSLERALAIVDAAAASGAHAIKLQTYRPDTITLDSDAEGFVINDENSLWHGRRLYDLYEEAATPWEWHEAIFEQARRRGLVSWRTWSAPSTRSRRSR
jgi:sialic acid synthase SpsE